MNQMKPRHRQLALGLFAGLSFKEIAARLNISIKTVEFHFAAMKREFKINTPADLVLGLCLGRLPI